MRDRGVFGPERAWSYALTLLSRRAYTVAEIRERVGRKGASPEVIEGVVSKLERYRLVDDSAYAEAYVNSRRSTRGSLRLRRELSRKGVSEEITEDSLAPLDPNSEIENARALLERNAWRFEGAEPQRNRARAFAFLARRGFPSEVVASALRTSSFLDEPRPRAGQLPKLDE